MSERSSHLGTALLHLERAFAPPRYVGAGSTAVLNRAARAELRAASDSLWYHRSEVGVDAESSFYLAIINRYLAYDYAAYSALMDEALQCDPNFVEAVIAKRSGVDYVDPYCYPAWNDLTTGVARPRPMPPGTGSSYAYVDLVRNDDRLVPAVFVYVATVGKFRTTLTDVTAAAVSVDILAIPPSLTAMMHVLPVVFDDLNDPFWKSTRLNLFPSAGDLGSIEIRLREDYDPWLGRNIATRFCAPPYYCALMVIAAGEIILTRLVEPEPSRAYRYPEMAASLRILPDKAVHPIVWQTAMKFHGDNFVTEVIGPNGQAVGIPRGRDPSVSNALLLPITTYRNRLATKAWVDAQTRPRLDESESDVFISHAHADSRWGADVEKWLLAMWPALRIARSEPSAGTEYADLTSFFELLSQTRCVLLLATPRAIRRPAVGAELGAAGCTVVLLGDGATEDDLVKLTMEEAFLNIDFDRVYSAGSKGGWHKLALCIASILQIELPASVPTGPPVPKSDSTTSLADATASFVADFAYTFARHLTGGRQTEAAAVRLLKLVSAMLARQHGPAFSGATLSPRLQLLALVLSIENNRGIVPVLK